MEITQGREREREREKERERERDPGPVRFPFAARYVPGNRNPDWTPKKTTA